MMGLWQKQLGKAADLLVTIPVGSEMWPASTHEPLVLAFVLPLSRHCLWKLGTLHWVCNQTQELIDLHKEDFGRAWCHLDKILAQARVLDGIPAGLV